MLTGVNTKPSSRGKINPYLFCKYNKLIVEMCQYCVIFTKHIQQNCEEKVVLNNKCTQKSSELKLWSNFFKNSCDGVNFKESCITCNFSSKSLYGYLS